MEQLIEQVLALLTDAGIPATEAMPDTAAPRLDAPACAVQLEKLTLLSPGLAQYLGLAEDPVHGTVERYGAKLEATVLVQVYSPASGGGAACSEAVSRALDALLAASDELPTLRVEADACRYEPRYDHFTAPIRVRLGAWVYGSSAEEVQRFTNFTLRGELQ